MISIVIPSRGEGEGLVACLAVLSNVADVGQIVVAAHAETVQTCMEVRRRHPGIVWIDCPRASRGDQLNRGAAAARGDALLFLHADTRLPRNAVEVVERALASPGVVGGAFRLGFDAPHPVLQLLSAMSTLPWRTAFFGDQAMFCTRVAFDTVGGFRDAPLFEDVDLALSLAARGRLVRVVATATTSARRFTRTGPHRQLLRNVSLLALYYVGYSPHALARSYRP